MRCLREKRGEKNPKSLRATELTAQINSDHKAPSAGHNVGKSERFIFTCLNRAPNYLQSLYFIPITTSIPPLVVLILPSFLVLFLPCDLYRSWLCS